MTSKQIFGIGLILFGLMWLTGCNSIVRGSGNVVTQDFETAGFTQIKVNGSSDVVLIQGDETHVSVQTDDNLIQYASAQVRGNTLYVELEGDNISISPTKLTFFVTVADIDGLAVSGSGDIQAAELTTDNLDITVSGSGDIYVQQLNAHDLSVHISGSGDVVVAGEITEQAVTINGSGQYVSKDLHSDTADVHISGSGEASVWAEEALTVRVSGSGDVSYYGNPQSVSTSGNGSGEITSRN